MECKLTPLEYFIYRAPLCPTHIFTDAKNFPSTYEYLKSVFSNENIREAIYISSKEFSEEIDYFLSNEEKFLKSEEKFIKFASSALSYINRMCMRSTPFGLMAGCGIGKFNLTDDQTTCYNPHFKPIIELDTEYLYTIVNVMIDALNLKHIITYYTNNTIYKYQNEYRYVEFFKNIKSSRIYNIVSTPINDIVKKVVEKSKNGESFNELSSFIQQFGYSVKDTDNFLDTLIESKVLVPEYEPNLIGKTFSEQITCFITKYTSYIPSNWQSILNKVLTPETNFNTLNAYKQISASLIELSGIDSKNILKIDTIIQADDFMLGKTVLKQIKKGFKYYLGLCQLSSSDISIFQFKTKFEQKYGSRFVRLTEALDPDCGIDYGFINNENIDYNPMIDDIPHIKTGNNTVRIDLSTINQYLIEKYQECLKNKSIVINIDPKEVDLSFDHSYIPPTINVFCNLAINNNTLSINYKELSGETSSSLYNRFSLYDEGIKDVYKLICEHEAECFNNQIVAEVNHLSDYRVGNILQRANYRDFEIPYITESQDVSGKIYINDLYLGIYEDRLVLYSKKHKKEIIPVISNAHNFASEYLPVYKFLGHFQLNCANYETYHSFNIDFLLEIFNFKPRVVVDNFVFSLATWKINKKDIRYILNMNYIEKIDALKKYLASRNIPLQFNIIKNDNKLYIDFINLERESLILFEGHITKSFFILIEEDFFTGKTSILNNQNQEYRNEFIIPMKNDLFKIIPSITPISLTESTKRTYYPDNNDWVYLKIYCNVNIANKIIANELSQITKKLTRDNLITKWFFIKYKEHNEFHLRLRFLLSNKARLSELIDVVNLHLKHYLDHEIYKVQIDTYSRELERYKFDNITDAESIFYIDSEAQIKIYKVLSDLENDDYFKSWSIAISIINCYLEAFDLSNDSKIDFIRKQRERYEKEFRCEKYQRMIINSKYEKYCYHIDNLDNYHSKEINDIITDLKTSLSQLTHHNKNLDLLDSYIHMSLLRFFKTRNRLNEYLAYSLFDRYLHKLYIQQKYMK